MKLNPEIKEKWVAALRSGEYTQTRSVLCDGSSYCCLGVLQKVVSGKCERSRGGTYLGLPSVAWANSVSLGDLDADDIVENDHFDPTVKDENTFMWSLSELNDAGRSFKEIADIIERNF